MSASIIPPPSAKFLTELIVKDSNGKRFGVFQPLIFHSAILGADIVVPEGFETDFASIPRFAWRIIPKNGEYDLAAVVHDWLYATQKLSREVSDAILREACYASKVPTWQTEVIYRAVRWFGGTAWRENQIKHGLPKTNA